MRKKVLLIIAALTLLAFPAQARGRVHGVVVKASAPPLVATGYPLRFGPYPYYDANHVYGIDGYAEYYDGWHTRAPDYVGACKLVAEWHIMRRRRMTVETVCVEW